MKKTEKRLDIISNYPDREYSDIWDTCCDHGKLGEGLIQHFPKSIIHFNDIAPHIVKKLESKLKNISRERYTLNTLDARKIKIRNDNTLIYICGIGGKLAIEIVNSLVNENTYNFELILCTHYHQCELRKFLRNNNFKLVRSELIDHQGRQYETIYVSRSRGHSIPPFSEELFNNKCLKSKAYFKKVMLHHENYINHSEFSKEIYKTYRELLSS